MAEETNGTTSAVVAPSSDAHTEASHVQNGDRAIDVPEQTSGSMKKEALGSDGTSEGMRPDNRRIKLDRC